MQIGARTAAWEKSGGWTNPYITDGLVAMWDGEWNIAGGMHEKNSNEWIDIIGGLRFQLTSQWKFGEKEAIHTIPQAEFSDIRVSSSPLGYSTSETTWEVVVDFSGTYGVDERSYLYRNFLAIYTYDGPYFIGDAGTWNKWNNSLQNISSISLTKAKPFLFSNTVTPEGKSSYYANGVFKTSLTGTVIPQIGQIALGNYSGGVAGGRELKWKCFRIYNRSLSASEIAANYDIDKARFNLT